MKWTGSASPHAALALLPIISSSTLPPNSSNPDSPTLLHPTFEMTVCEREEHE